MFTGIIEQTGTLVSLKETGGARRITVEAPGIAGQLREGDSLAVSGVCLTALDVNPTYFHADLAQETLDRTSLGALAPGANWPPAPRSTSSCLQQRAVPSAATSCKATLTAQVS
jgi:riboflavin synthase